MKVLVDSSVWVDYFRGVVEDAKLDFLIDENLVVVNDLILTELIPVLHLRKQNKLINLMQEIACPPMHIDWDGLVQMQIVCLQQGINKVGIPDLIIVQHALQNQLELYTRDKHFKSIAKHVPLSLL